MKAEVRCFRQYQRVFRLSLFSVGRIVYGADLSQGLADSVTTPPVPLGPQKLDTNKLQNELAQYRVYSHLGGARESRISLQSARSSRSCLRRNMRGNGSRELAAYGAAFISAEMATGTSLNHGSDGSIRSRRSSIRNKGKCVILTYDQALILT